MEAPGRHIGYLCGHRWLPMERGRGQRKSEARVTERATSAVIGWWCMRLLSKHQFIRAVFALFVSRMQRLGQRKHIGFPSAKQRPHFGKLTLAIYR